MKSSPFCTCTDYTCEFNPANHDKGCNLCIEDSLKTREIPRCYFLLVQDNIDDIDDWSIEAFARLALKQ
ncbi:DUF6485 family protein [Bacillota bacterium]